MLKTVLSLPQHFKKQQASSIVNYALISIQLCEILTSLMKRLTSKLHSFGKSSLLLELTAGRASSVLISKMEDVKRIHGFGMIGNHQSQRCSIMMAVSQLRQLKLLIASKILGTNCLISVILHHGLTLSNVSMISYGLISVFYQISPLNKFTHTHSQNVQSACSRSRWLANP